MGRSNSGLLQFMEAPMQATATQGLNLPANETKQLEMVIPAQPGSYHVFGLPINVVNVGRFKLTYSIPKA